ncbi:MAG: hypothetical protein N2645_09915 [Clostridia bacterium]|nr:hypothetical protein [Clostridia bacterium]
MIKIKPDIEYELDCPYCNQAMNSKGLLWQGIHTCVVASCSKCSNEFVYDLPIGQAVYTPFVVDLKNARISGDADTVSWFGKPLLNSLKCPKKDDIKIEIQKMRECRNAIILNCIDFLFGHALLKLLNAESYIKHSPDTGLIIIIPQFLKWMAPEGAAEIWSVDIPLSKALDYYEKLNAFVNNECSRFETVYLSRAYSHPTDFKITNFTNVRNCVFDENNYRITFIWREDRMWEDNNLIYRINNRLKIAITKKAFVYRQKHKVCKLFDYLRKSFPKARFTIAGFGNTAEFPDWIEDKRVNSFSSEIERKLCETYAESVLIIGVHGSNMLLPSAHAGMVIDLMPDDRWDNMAQDIIYQPNKKYYDDDRIFSWRYRYLPVSIGVKKLSIIIKSMVGSFDIVQNTFITGKDN